MATKKSQSSKVTKTAVEVDLTGVEAGRRRKKVIPEGTYNAKLISAEGKKFSTNKRGVVWIFEVTDKGPGLGWRAYHNTVFIDENGEVMTNSLWTIRGVLEAFTPKLKVPDRAIKIELTKYLGRTVAIDVVTGEDQEGRDRSEVLSVFNQDELDEDEEQSEDDLEDEEEEEEEGEEEEEEDEEDEEEDEVDLEEDEL